MRRTQFLRSRMLMLRIWLGLSVLALVLVAVGCGGSDSAVAITNGDQIAGRYRAEGTNPNTRTSYSGGGCRV